MGKIIKFPKRKKQQPSLHDRLIDAKNRIVKEAVRTPIMKIIEAVKRAELKALDRRIREEDNGLD